MDLRDLYQSTILDHNKRPRNFRHPEDANRHAEGFNPLCGDRIDVWLRVEDGIIRDVAFQGTGCAISQASASLMTEAVKGRPVEEAIKAFDRFHELVTGPADRAPGPDELGKLAVFSGVRDYPMRVKCATLSWHTLRAAIRNQSEVARTE